VTVAFGAGWCVGYLSAVATLAVAVLVNLKARKRRGERVVSAEFRTETEAAEFWGDKRP
jgi:hypothetical protein